MKSLKTLVEEIVLEFARIQAQPQPFHDDKDAFQFPRMIDGGAGRQIFISKVIDNAISDIARRLHRDDPSASARFTTAEFTSCVRRAFGPPLAEIDIQGDLQTNAQLVLDAVKAACMRETTWVLSGNLREYACGCTLFSYPDLSAFEVGAVRFEPREMWLDRVASGGRSLRVGRDGRVERFDHQIAEGPISMTAKRRILQTWRCRSLRKRKPSHDAICEQDIIDAIGDCPYVSSVRTVGLAAAAGKDRALLAARLALAAVALMWEKPSRALEGFNLLFDREARRRSVLSITSDGLVLADRNLSGLPHGPWIERRQLETSLQDHSPVFAVAGEAIGCFLRSQEDITSPKLMKTLAQSLMWFHEGCREASDIVAVVKFAASLDALAGGKGETEICKLITARLGIGKDVQVHRDGFAMKTLVRNIYNDTRSRMIHGTHDRLGHDTSEVRVFAEWFARGCLLSSLRWAAENPNVDDPEFLLQPYVAHG